MVLHAGIKFFFDRYNSFIYTFKNKPDNKKANHNPVVSF